ncbi:MAG: ATP-binding protein [Rubrivivax sp.]
MRQLLVNYLGNALKFTAEGRVELRALRRGERVRFEVVDTGPGIDAAAQQRLFTPFTQGDESTTRRFGGTGLGLSICRELAHLMGGEVGLLSAPGAGSCFWAELPLPPCAAPAPPAAPAEHELEGMRVLMVEDNPVNMMIAVAILERWGVQAEQASEGLAALEAVERAAAEGRPFEAVLMDVQMPVMSGYEATRALRRSAAGAQVPVIALTAAALVSEREQALAAGMDDFLTKPIDADRLRATLARWRGRQH